MATPVWRNLYKHLCNSSQFHTALTVPTAKTVSFSSAIRGCLNVSKRGMAAGRTMKISPSRFEWTRFKNDLHFYTLLGVIPLGSVILYSNLILGHAELVDIPEGYEPKEWEYHKHPICRWFAKYVYTDPAKQYEMAACKTVHTFEAARNNARIARVKEMMKRDDDYRSFYFVPAVDPRGTEFLAKEYEDFKLNQKGSR